MPRNQGGAANAPDRLRRARLAHMRQELMAPAAAVLGYVEMLSEAAQDGGAVGMEGDIANILQSAEFLVDMVEHLLDPDNATTAEADDAGLQRRLRHDLRNPLNAICGYSELLLEEIEDHGAEALREDIETVLGEADRLQSRLDTIIDFTSLDDHDSAGAGRSAEHNKMLSDLVETIRRIDKDKSEAPTGRILVVDDNESNRKLLSRRLGRDGHEVLTAASGREALAILGGGDTVDLILLDLIMPDMNGFQVLEQLKADSELRRIPTIMISGIGEVDSVVRCIELGAEDYLQKPFNPVLLRARVGACLEKRRLRDRERAYLEFNDAVTGLPNRAHFMRELEKAILRRARHGLGYAVIRLNINQIEQIQESLGRDAADELVLLLARAIRHLIIEEAVLARVGPGEFGVLLSGERDTNGVIEFADILRAQLSLPAVVRGVEIVPAIFASIALSATCYETADEAMRDADLAVARAKTKGMTSCEVADRRMLVEAMERLNLEADLRRAIEREDLFLAYQPIVDLKSRRWVGLEALVRWRHAERGVLGPVEFIPLAEETGLIKALGAWVLRQAVMQIGIWRTKYPQHADLFIAVNASAAQFEDSDFLLQVRNLLADQLFAPESLTIEMTETIMMGNPDRAMKLLDDLHTLQISSAIDDFGTGYSSLSYLNRFAFKKLKIDRSFVTEIGIRPRNQQILMAMVLMAKGLGMKVVAEGIETEDEAEFLRAIDCDFGQGYLFSRPVSPGEIEAGLSELPLK